MSKNNAVKIRDGESAPLVGAHMSIAGGVTTAFARAVEAGCATMQIFTKNATRWEGHPLLQGEVEEFRREAGRSGVAPVFSHGSYLVNLASPDRDLLRRSREAFLEELRRADALGLPFVVTHPGAHMGSGVSAGLARVAESLDWLEERTGGKGAAVCLENTAGQGTVLAGEFGQLREILGLVRSPGRVGVCLDTCHAHAAGYDLSSAEACRRALDDLEAAVGPSRIRAVHLNDAKAERGSRVDRHEHLGRGRIGLECFRALMNEPGLLRVPKVIETPKEEDGRQMDPVNLGVLRALVGRSRVPPGVLRMVGAAGPLVRGPRSSGGSAGARPRRRA